MEKNKKQSYELTSLLSSSKIKSSNKSTTYFIDKAKTPIVYDRILSDDCVIPFSTILVLKDEEKYAVKMGDGINTWSECAEFSGGGDVEPLPEGTIYDVMSFDEEGKVVAQRITAWQLTDIGGKPSYPFGVLCGASLHTDNPILLFSEARSTPKAGTLPLYATGGKLVVNTGTADTDVANVGQLPKASTTNPLANGTASVGTSALYARQDHVHPLQTTVTGNAGTATTLATGRTFSLTGGATGTSATFNGSANASIPVTLAEPTSTVRGGVLKQSAIPDLSGDEPIDISDYNKLLAVLRASGILAQ